MEDVALGLLQLVRWTKLTVSASVSTHQTAERYSLDGINTYYYIATDLVPSKQFL